MGENETVEVVETTSRRRRAAKESDVQVETATVNEETTPETEVAEDKTTAVEAEPTESEAVEEEVQTPRRRKKAASDVSVFKEDTPESESSESSESDESDENEEYDFDEDEVAAPSIPADGSDSMAVEKEDAKLQQEAEDAINSDKEAASTEVKIAKKEKEKALNQSSKSVAEGKVYNDTIKGIETMSKQEKRKIYSDGGIIPIKDELQIKSEGEKREQDYMNLVSAYRQQTYLTGKISSVSTLSGMPAAVVKYGSFNVYIPGAVLLSDAELNDIEKADTPKEKELRTRRYLNQRIRSEIDFIVKGIDEENKKAVADRRAAMSLIYQSWYTTKENANSDYVLREGRKVEARIVSASRSVLVIEIWGREYRLRSKDISYVRIPDISKEYPVGKTVAAVFTKLERQRNEKGDIIIKAAVSIKDADSDPRKEYFDMYNIGDVTTGTVTGLTEDGIYVRIEGTEGKHDIMCAYSKDKIISRRSLDLPYVGQDVLCKVTKKTEFDDKGNPIYRIYGVITRRF